MIKVGLTGGIGSGKTFVGSLFSKKGIPVYNSDNRAKYLMLNNQKVVNAIKEEFGSESYYSDGALNKEHLSKIIFSDDTKRLAINKIVHPAVQIDFEEWSTSLNNVPYCLKEAAILFESGGNKKLDYTITVYASPDIRLKRVVSRDQVNRKSVLARMNSQLSDYKKLKLCNFAIHNDEDMSLENQINKIHNTILTKEKR